MNFQSIVLNVRGLEPKTVIFQTVAIAAVKDGYGCVNKLDLLFKTSYETVHVVRALAIKSMRIVALVVEMEKKSNPQLSDSISCRC